MILIMLYRHRYFDGQGENRRNIAKILSVCFRLTESSIAGLSLCILFSLVFLHWQWHENQKYHVSQLLWAGFCYSALC